MSKIPLLHGFDSGKTFLEQTSPGTEVNYITVWLHYHF